MLNIKEQLASDLEKKLGSFHNRKVGMRKVSYESGLHIKTLNRILNKENSPNHQTLIKVYRYLFNTNSEKELLKLVPDQVRVVIEKKLNFNTPSLKVDYFVDIEEEIYKDRVYSIIYCLAGAGKIERSYIGFKFGKYGLDVIDKMIQQDVLKTTTDVNVYILGNKRASFGPDTIKKVGLDLLQFFLSPEKSLELDQNFFGLYAEGLSESCYQKWIEIDQKAYDEKVALASREDSSGEIRAFTFNATDIMMGAYEKNTFH